MLQSNSNSNSTSIFVPKHTQTQILAFSHVYINLLPISLICRQISLRYLFFPKYHYFHLPPSLTQTAMRAKLVKPLSCNISINLSRAFNRIQLVLLPHLLISSTLLYFYSIPFGQLSEFGSKPNYLSRKKNSPTKFAFASKQPSYSAYKYSLNS